MRREYTIRMRSKIRVREIAIEQNILLTRGNVEESSFSFLLTKGQSNKPSVAEQRSTKRYDARRKTSQEMPSFSQLRRFLFDKLDKNIQGVSLLMSFLPLDK